MGVGGGDLKPWPFWDKRFYWCPAILLAREKHRANPNSLNSHFINPGSSSYQRHLNKCPYARARPEKTKRLIWQILRSLRDRKPSAPLTLGRQFVSIITCNLYRKRPHRRAQLYNCIHNVHVLHNAWIFVIRKKFYFRVCNTFKIRIIQYDDWIGKRFWNPWIRKR